MWKTFRNLHFNWHLALGFVLRTIFILYGVYHDEYFTVPYTDVDYKVFTDASRHVLQGGSPYDRHTYRYSPLIAIILTPNITFPQFGKFLFSSVDILVAILIKSIVGHLITRYDTYKSGLAVEGNTEKLVKPSLKSIRNRSRKSRHERSSFTGFNFNLGRFKTEGDMQAEMAAMLWIYNPLAIAIATRGNGDSIAGLLVLATLYLLQVKGWVFVSGLVHGLSVHFRLYPIIYSLSLFMYLSSFSYYTNNRFVNGVKEKTKEVKNAKNKLVQEMALEKTDNEKKTIFRKVYLMYLIPNLDQLKLVCGCISSLSILTSLFYYLYGYTFLFETYIYHLVRQDTRHNFSLFFYLQYLTAGVKNIGLWQKVLISLPQLVLLVVFSIRYGLNKLSLNFSILTQTITMVTYNTVLTSQYFIWIVVVLPLSVWQIKMSLKLATFLAIIWITAQAAWLLPAYYLEFHGQNTFLYIWIQSVSFFCANIAILGRLIMNFMPVRRHKLH